MNKELPKGFTPDIPSLYQIEVTNDCQLNCPSCFRNELDRPIGYIKHDLIKTILDRDSDGSHFIELQFVGEPLLHPNIEYIIDMIKDKNILVGLSTNGQLIHKKLNAVNKLDYLTISVDSLNKKEYQKIRKGGSLDTLVRNIKLLKDNTNTNIDLQVVDYGYNIGQMNEIRQFLDENYIENMNIRYVPDCFETLFDKDKIKDVKKELCLNPYLSVSVQYNGDVVSCCFNGFSKFEDNIYGNLNEQSLEEIWNGDKVKRMRERQESGDYPALCKRCYMSSPELLHNQILFDRLKKK